MSYKTIFSGSAGPFSGILRLRVAGLMTLRFFAKRLFRVTCGSAFILSAFVSRDLCFGLYPVGFRVARLVARPFFCRLPCRATCGPGFILSAFVSRDLWSGLYVIGLLSSPVPPPSLPPPSSRSLSPEPPYGSTIPFLPG